MDIIIGVGLYILAVAMACSFGRFLKESDEDMRKQILK